MRLLVHWGLIGLSIVEIQSLEHFRSNELKKSNLSSEQKSHFAMNKKYLSPSTSTLFHFTTTINRFLRRALVWCFTLWPILHFIELHSMAGLRKYLTTKCPTMFRCFSSCKHLSKPAISQTKEDSQDTVAKWTNSQPCAIHGTFVTNNQCSNSMQHSSRGFTE